MYFTNGQFVAMLLEDDHVSNQLVHYLLLAEKLIKKYGKLLFVAEILELIQQEDTALYHLLLLLKRTNKVSIRDIKAIRNLFKQSSSDYKKEFVISLDKEFDIESVVSRVKKEFFGAKVSRDDREDASVSLSGEGRYYKKDFLQDAKKLLNL
ncbi:MAG: hypothetical protein GXP45_08085 [bacterium]|nr:hypothetical protein [bacterium]